MNESANLDTFGYDLSDPDEYAAFCYRRQNPGLFREPPPQPILRRQNAAQVIVIDDSSDSDDIDIYIDPSIIYRVLDVNQNQ